MNRKDYFPRLVNVEGNWPKGNSVETVERSLIAKLPFILINAKNNQIKKGANNGNITVFQKFLTPSATPSREKSSLVEVTGVSTSKLPNLKPAKNVKSHHQRSVDLSNADYIDFVDCKNREILPRPPEITSPFHITVSDPLKFKAELDTGMSYYMYPTATDPFCIGRSLEKSQSAVAWRDSQKQVFLWESRFSAKRIHKNFQQGNLEKYYGKTLSDFQSSKLQSLPKGHPPSVGYRTSAKAYHYPDRFLPSDQSDHPLPATAPAVVGAHETFTILEFFLDMTELGHAKKETLSRLQTAVEKLENKEERYRRKQRVIARDHAAMLCRKMYALEF